MGVHLIRVKRSIDCLDHLDSPSEDRQYQLVYSQIGNSFRNMYKISCPRIVEVRVIDTIKRDKQ